jgi:predicted outer membrane repeat protein
MKKLIISLFVLTNFTFATTINVPADYPTIQAGIDAAVNGDTVLVAAGIYEGGIVISNKAISLIGESREGTKINQPISSPQISIVDCQAGTTRVENFIIKQGSSNNGGGIYSSESIVEIDSVDFSYNSSSNNGAAINSIESTVKVQNSTFSHNTSDNLGGAIYVDPLTTCEIYNSSFDNNEALWGGAIATVGGGKLLVEGCNISFNTASGNNPNPNENYPTFGGGGGIYQEWSDSLEIYDSEITNNTAATGAGGGIAVYLSDDVTINNIVLSDNSSSGPNYPSGGGGAAFYRADNVLFENSTIANNVSNHNSGGGIFLGSESGQASIVVHATFNRLTLVNNSALSGGAIFCWSAILNLYHSTLAQNEASNSEWSGGGLASHYVTEPNIISSLFYDNIPNSIHNGYPYTPVLVAYSLVQEWWAGWGNLIDVDPLFCDPDSGDYSLAENSPCVGAGEDGSNMGAYGIGCDPIILSISSELLPVTYILHQNYPNPFNPVTTLRYDLPENNLVNITIYDMMGRKVKTLVNQTQDTGYKSVVWDATNDYGKPVSAGIYLYQIQAGEYISTKKMVLLK